MPHNTQLQKPIIGARNVADTTIYITMRLVCLAVEPDMRNNGMDEDNNIKGASGLTDEDLEFFMDSRAELREIPASAVLVNESGHAVISDGNDIAIAQALMECGQNPDMLQNPIFIKYYNQVAEGPGREWPIERRVGFVIQTMNRMGALEIGTESQHISGNLPNRQRPDISEPTQANCNPREPKQEDLAIFGYHHLDKQEIIDNLIIVGGVLVITILAVSVTYLCIILNVPKASAGIGTISLAAIIASVVRLARKWHQRFTFKYRMVRLIVCMALLFSTAAWHVAKSAWQFACYLTNSNISIPKFGVSMFGLLSVISLLSRIKLCRVYDPRHARFLGWIEALALTFAIGAFLFCAIHKP